MSAVQTMAKLYNTSQSWFYETLWTLDPGNPQRLPNPVQYKVRVKIERNAYDAQSGGRAFLFSPEKLEWNGAAFTAGPSLKCLEICYVMKEDVVRQQYMGVLLEDTMDLVKEVASILNVPLEKAKAKVKA